MAVSGGAALDPGAAVVREREEQEGWRRERGPATALRRPCVGPAAALCTGSSRGGRRSARWGRWSEEGRRWWGRGCSPAREEEGGAAGKKQWVGENVGGRVGALVGDKKIMTYGPVTGS